jgi:AraC-like DNA-binding protein
VVDAILDMDTNISNVDSTYKILRIISGKIHVFSSVGEEIADSGDCIVINPFETHSLLPITAEVECSIAYANASLMQRLAVPELEDDSYPYFILPVFSKKKIETADRNDDEIIPCDRKLDINRKLRDIIKLAKMSNGLRFRSTLIPAAVPDPIRKACQFIIDSPNCKVDLSAVPGLVGLSRYHFIRMFSRSVGLSPRTYMRCIRLSRARSQVALGLPLASIATDIGFSDQAHMTREFSIIYGYTPGQLSRKIFRANKRGDI